MRPVEKQDEQELKELQETEKNKRRRFDTLRAEAVHIFSCYFCINTLAVTLPYIFIVWQQGLISELLTNFVFCILAASLAICWAFYWRCQLAPKILAAKRVRKNQRWVLWSVIFVALIYVERVLYGSSPVSLFIPIAFIIGGRIVIELGFAWADYRKSPEYETVSFIDFCNEVVSGEK